MENHLHVRLCITIPGSLPAVGISVLLLCASNIRYLLIFSLFSLSQDRKFGSDTRVL